MTDITDSALNSKAWPFIEADRILKKIGGKPPEKRFVLFETGYGPSGLPHIGTFAEVARTTMIRNAFTKLSDIPTKLYCFSDDMDGMRKVPSNLPNQEMLHEHLDKPLTGIPDPFGEETSFGAYMNGKLKSFLNKFGFEYDFFSATECYKSGMFDEYLLRALEKYDDIMELMLPTFREERRATYSPFMPICPETGRVLQVPIIDRTKTGVIYENEKGEKVEVPVTGGHCKLQWKPDFGMRWAALDVDYEMYGKDHQPNTYLYAGIAKILGGSGPINYFYEMFLDENGQKISKSKGNAISMDDWLKYAPLESMSLFLYQSPTKAKRLFFDVIPKSVDEYLTFNRKYYEEEDLTKRLANPVYHIHGGDVPEIETFGITFNLLLNLVSICNTDDKNVLWGFIKNYKEEACPEEEPFLDHLTEFAISYYNDFIKPNKKFIEPSEKHKELLGQIKEALASMDKNTEAEDIQKAVYALGREAGYENLRDFFKELYQILLGQEEGPRLGSFFKLYGIDKTIELIESKV